MAQPNPFTQFQYNHLVRYVANNCDSEQMLTEPSEEFVRQNLLEYMRVHWTYGGSSMSDRYQIEYPIEDWENLPSGENKKLDFLGFGKDRKFALCIEIKYLGSNRGYMPKIFKDISRLLQIETGTTSRTRRCMMVVGRREHFNHVFMKRGLKDVLSCPHWWKFEQGNDANIFEGLDQKEKTAFKKITPAMLAPFGKAVEGLDNLKNGFRVRVTGIYRPNTGGFRPHKAPGYNDFMDVGLWEVRAL